MRILLACVLLGWMPLSWAAHGYALWGDLKYPPGFVSFDYVNANAPKGAIEQDERHYQIYTNDQASHAEDYKPLVIAYRNGAAVRLSDVATVVDSVEDFRVSACQCGQFLPFCHWSVLLYFGMYSCWKLMIACVHGW